MNEEKPPTLLSETMRKSGTSFYSLQPACAPGIECNVKLYANGWAYSVYIGYQTIDSHFSDHPRHFSTAQEAADAITQWFRELANRILESAGRI